MRDTACVTYAYMYTSTYVPASVLTRLCVCVFVCASIRLCKYSGLKTPTWYESKYTETVFVNHNLGLHENSDLKQSGRPGRPGKEKGKEQQKEEWDG